MLSEKDIIINKFAQDKITLDEVLLWFDNKSSEEQRDILSWTRIYLEQSHPDKVTIDAGLTHVPLKPTMTPIVLLQTQPFKTALLKINSLPDNEIRKGFITIITIFKLADTKRREHWCKDGCTHEWHNLNS